MTRNELGRKADSNKWKMLCNNGPQPYSKIGKIEPKLRQDGVRKFCPNSNHSGASESGAGKSPTIYYIENKHSRKTVIKTWLNEHTKAKEQLSKMAIHARICDYGERWKEASRELLGPFKKSGGNSNPDPNQGGICPLCNNNFNYTLPKHLQECSES